MAYQNFFATKLFTDIGAADTSITLETPPSATSGRLTLEARNPTQREIIKYTGVSGNQITGVLRGQGGTTAKSHIKSSLVEMNATGEDFQDLLDAFASFTNTNTDWRSVIGTPVFASNLGNKEGTFTVPLDITSITSPGAKVQLTRAAAAPTQCMSFTAASSQYVTKATPAGISMTAAYTVEAWVYLKSYTTGGGSVILAHFDNAATTGGFGFQIGTGGFLQTYYGTGSSFTSVGTFRAVPLNTWTHLAVTVTVATQVVNFYLNGELLPDKNIFASAATTLTQPTTDLRIGAASANPTGTYFDGYLSEVRLWNVAQSQAAILANMGSVLIGSETNLVGLWQGNGVGTDKTANANTMTANGGAIFTQLGNPYNTNEMLEIISEVYGSPNTTVTVRAQDGFVLPSGTLSAMKYSFADQPYNYPSNSKVISRINIGQTQVTAGASDLKGFSTTFTVPANVTKVRVEINMPNASAVSGTQFVLNLMEGAAVVRGFYSYSANGSNAFNYQYSALVAVTPGTHTWKLNVTPTGSNITTAPSANTGFIPEMTISKG